MAVKLYFGDCLEFMRMLPAGGIDLTLTDPPYGIGVQNNYAVGNRKDKPKDDIDWDNNAPSPECFSEMRRVSQEQIIWGANYFNCFSSGGGAIVWDKLQPLPDSSQCEIASYSRLKKVFKYTQRWTNFVNTKQTSHPTEKPLELFLWLIEMFTAPGATVFDPFMGSGTTGVACGITGRKFAGCEKDADYFALAERRIENAYSQQRFGLCIDNDVPDKGKDQQRFNLGF